MSAGKPHLEQIQRWMQSVIMHPGGVAEAVDSAEARQYLDVKLADLESVIGRSRALSSANRLEIYVNAYYARLMECLDEEFVVTRYALGDELFEALAFGYLQHYPSHSYTLGQLGARFPQFLAETRLHATEAPPDAEASWPDFVAELATLERLLYEVYDGPGTERSGVLNPAEIARISADAGNDLRLIGAPCLRLVRFEHPVSEYWMARKDGGQPAPCRRRLTQMAIHRRNYVVERRELEATEFTLLAEILGGASLLQAISAALESLATPTADAALLESRVGTWFTRWAEDGYFVDVERARE